VGGKVQFRWLRDVGRTHICERDIPHFRVSCADLSRNLGNSRLRAAVPARFQPTEHSAFDARMATRESCLDGTLCGQHRLASPVERSTGSISCLCVVAGRRNKRSVETSPLSDGQNSLCSLSPTRSYRGTSSFAASGSPKESPRLFPHSLEDPSFSNSLFPVAANVSALE